LANPPSLESCGTRLTLNDSDLAEAGAGLGE